MGISVPPTINDRLSAALSVLERRQATIANNLANVSTVGFKGERTFTALMADGATPVIETATDLRPGAVTATANPLDLAIAGEGYFLVRTPNGERLTCTGQFGQNRSGELVDVRGNVVLSEGLDPSQRRPLQVPAGAREVVIGTTGDVRADGELLGRLALHTVPDGATVRHEADGLLVSSAPTLAVAESARAVRQGAIEESNVSAVDTLVQMISVQRLYATAQRALSAVDAAHGIAVSEIGKPL